MDNLVRASVFNLELLDILRDSIRNLIKMLLSFQFSKSFCFQSWASRYITGLNQTSELKSDCHLNLLGASTFTFERLVILRVSFIHPSKKLLSFELAQRFNIQFRATRYITSLNRTSEKKVIVVWIGLEVQHSISSVSIYYGTLSDIRVKSYCR